MVSGSKNEFVHGVMGDAPFLRDRLEHVGRDGHCRLFVCRLLDRSSIRRLWLILDLPAQHTAQVVPFTLFAQLHTRTLERGLGSRLLLWLHGGARRPVFRLHLLVPILRLTVPARHTAHTPPEAARTSTASGGHALLFPPLHLELLGASLELFLGLGLLVACDNFLDLFLVRLALEDVAHGCEVDVFLVAERDDLVERAQEVERVVQDGRFRHGGGERGDDADDEGERGDVLWNQQAVWRLRFMTSRQECLRSHRQRALTI